MLSTKERNELISKSGEKIVLGWNSVASESKALESWRNSGNQSGEKIGKNSGTPLADNTPFSTTRASEKNNHGGGIGEEELEETRNWSNRRV